MDEIKYTETTPKKKHPFERANVIARFLFCWLLPFFYKGLKRELHEDDMYATRKSDESGRLGNQLEEAWNSEVGNKKNPSLFKAIFSVFKWEFGLYALLHLFNEIIRISQPIFISKLLKFYEPNQTNLKVEDAYLYAGLIIFGVLINVFTIHNFQLRVMTLGMRIRVATCSLIYRKALKLSKSALAKTTIGQMVNLLSNDVGRFDFAAQHIHNLWITPLETIFIMYVLFLYVGWCGLIGAIFLLLFVPFQMFMGKKTSQYRLRTAIRTDERVRLMNEVVSGIQVIKMYTWEKTFAKLVELSRRKEIEQIRATSIIRAIMMSCNLILNQTAIFFCIVVYILTGNVLNASYVYTVTSFYSVLRKSVTMLFPQAITQFAETTVSVKRIKTFLLYEEIDMNYKHVINSKNGMNGLMLKKHKMNDIGIRLSNLSVKWLNSLHENSLDNINLDVSSNQLIAVVGPVGGGKTTLLHAILKELPPQSGTIDVVGSVSYVSQEPWLFGGSVRQNILFGQAFNQKKYDEVVRVCALERDFALLPHRDRTLVGERGITLSGGQRARINLARAVYKDSDIYLLDDPLSAVDTHVGKDLFNHCIRGYLGNKCIILVTHQLQYLRDVHEIFLLENGRVTVSGSYQELLAYKTQFTKILSDAEEEEKDTYESNILPKDSREKELLDENVIFKSIKLEREDKASGVISLHVYKSYFKAGGNICKTIFLCFAFILSQTLSSSNDYFLMLWVNFEQSKLQNETSMTEALNITSTEIGDNNWRSWINNILFVDINTLYIYSGLVASTMIVTISRSIGFFNHSLVISKRLHNNMFNKIVYSPMRFFNKNPSGRILNRFSKDIGAVDETLPITLVDTIQIGLAVLSVSVVVGTLNVWIFLPTLIMLTIFYFMRIVFLASSRNIKRIESITHSPVYTHLTATLQGLTTIRAFEAQQILTVEFDRYQDLNTSAYYIFLTASRTFGFWLDFHCVMYVGFIILSILFIENELFGGNVGLALTQSMTLTGMFQWGMRQWSELENQMTSVERVQEYVDLQSETDAYVREPTKEWPERGNIAFKNLCLKYSPDGNYVLKNLDFEIQPNKKVGIVGRTGAGKSSIIQALFRLTDTEGSIHIDNVDTKEISLRTLRSHISIIPQEPVLFSGTLRGNIDPFEEYSDDILWKALDDVELKRVVEEFPSGLYGTVAEGGSNFSVGQRQLICLARAIIRNNKILVLDEATANVDPHTDALIQETIRRKFADCTVLTVAHRLHTIMDSDEVLVMDAGRVVEFGHPHLLLQNKGGYFYQLIKQTGSAMASNLQNIAESHYINLNK